MPDWLPPEFRDPRALIAPLLGVGALCVFLFLRVLWPRTERKRREALRAAWGEDAPKRRRIPETIAALHVQLRALPAEGPAALDLSDEGAEDLDLHPLFAVLDRTLTEPGQQALYRLLRRPLLDLAALRERGRVLRLLGEDAAVREALQLALLPLADAPQGSLVPLLEPGRSLALPLPAPVYAVLALLAVGSLALWATLGAAGLLAVGLVYVLNMVVHLGAERAVSTALPGLLALRHLLGAAERLARAKLGGLEEAQAALGERLAALAPFSRLLAGAGPPPQADDLMLYVNIFFLRQVRLLAGCSPLIARHRAALLALVEQVGALDALVSVASFRAGQPGWCEPALAAEATALEVEGLRHPLLPDAQPNSLSLSGGALVTGSNMSGKSTFLRTLGVNALLAQTVFTCSATRWSSPLLRLATSLRRSDSLLAGRSYYLAEAEGILAALCATATPPRVLCLLDEIFRGTNTAERVAAAAAVLRWLAARGALVVAATHDDPLTRLLGPVYRNYHFSETLSAEGLSFDYLLKEGPATTRNAIALLRHLGYPEEIVNEALSLA